MNIFDAVKTAIFGKKDEDEAKVTPAPTSATTTARTSPTPMATATPAARQAATTSHSTSVVDVENRLDSMPGADRLNWRTSIVDLLKLIGVDPSYENRKALAGELGRSDYSGSAEDNVWLHRKTMQELSRNGGKVPAEFLD